MEGPIENVRISVIIPTYNMGEYVGEAVGSVLDCGFEDVQVLVVDDGSTDSTQSVLEKYTDPSSSSYDGRVRYIYQENRGKSAAVNRGLDMARGEYITMLDADDQLCPGSLETRYEARYDVSGNPSDLVIGGFEVFNREGTHGRRNSPKRGDTGWLHDRFYLGMKTPFHLNACLISRRLVNRVGGLDESLHRCIDGDYALRLLRAAKTAQVVEEVVYRYRKYRSSWFERTKYRFRTAWYRSQVIWKNYKGWRRWVGVPFGIMLDTGKFLYEIVDSYKK